jgi:uncharacterized protein
MDRNDFVVFLHKIPPEGLLLSWEIAGAREAGITLDVPLDGPLSAEFRVERFGAEMRVSGSVRATAVLECSRCLRRFPLPIQGQVEVAFAPRAKEEGEESHELSGEDLDVEPLVGGATDLRDLIAEQIHLALPMKPLCSPACRGICPRCGSEVADGSCGCAPAGGDPRWEALKKLTISKG